MKLILIHEMVRIALSAIWANKLRSFLTILGNVVAVSSIITLVSLIQGITEEVESVILSEVGADAFLVDRRGIMRSEEDLERTRNNPRITLADAEAIRRFASGVTAVMAEGRRSGEVRYRQHVLESVRIQGVTEEFIRFSTFNAEIGRLMTPAEVRRKRNVAVLGSDTADRLFGALDPIDRQVKIRGVPFRVIGVSRPQGSSFGQSQDEFAVVPLGAFQRLFGSRTALGLRVQPADPGEIDRAIGETTVALRVERRLKASEDDNFGIFTSETALRIFNQATAGIFAVLVGVVGLALVVAGIVIMNIMLMAVSERTKEIGLRKALGARRQDILWQMLSESVALSVLGGAAGTALGAAAALALDRFAPVPAVVHPWSVLLAITMTAAVGLFFGLYPAARAAALDPIDALGRAD
ncbi:MAG: ABC transporter permease [Acidobacteria bacterium]|nr:ABC transporter permease [Acidobacteriota bacterium]MYH28834.1 ABC transporter permease [Acidobacteriota bacterium]